MKIILGGPRKSGKSCLREGIKQAILRIPDAPYPYILTGCPDGEGSWFSPTANLSAEIARMEKEAYKSKFTPGFVERVSMAVMACSEPLTFVDIGGIPSEENKAICSYTSHAILIAGDYEDRLWKERLSEWWEFCEELHIEVIAELYSDYYGDHDEIWSQDQGDVFKGSIHYLERGVDISGRPTIKALAQWIIKNFFPKAHEVRGKGS